MSKFGRLIAPDYRDQSFRLRSVVAPAPKVLDYKNHNANGWWGNQGNRPYCVGYGLAHFIEDAPITHPGGPFANPVDIYNNAQKLDEWPGEDYEGTSVRAGMKYLQSLGLIESYHWGYTLEELVAAVFVSVVPVGTTWYSYMSEPSSEGRISVGGEVEGGHCYLINGVNKKTRMFRGKNSWGRDWANKGLFTISFEDMEKLILDYGEICLAVEKKK